MGFSCCKCTKKNLKESLVLVPGVNQKEKPIENRNLNKANNSDYTGENSAINDTTQRTIEDKSKKSVNLKKALIKGPKYNVSLLYGEVGIIDSQIRIEDNNKN